MNSLRDSMKDMLRGYLEGFAINDTDEYICSMADDIFKVLSITEKQQASKFGGKWVSTFYEILNKK